MNPSCYSAKEVKQAAVGQWRSILPEFGISNEKLDGRGHPCPKCGGNDRFSAFADFEETGGVSCRHCFDSKNGDGLAAVKWITGCSFAEGVKRVAGIVSMADCDSDYSSGESSRDIIGEVCRAKRMPESAFLEFGAVPAKRGRKEVVRIPVYNQDGVAHSHFDLSPDEKGWFKRGKGNSGLFFPGKVPQPGKTLILVEGVKDAAALTSLGYFAAGLPRADLPESHTRLFTGCDVVVVPDLDTAGMKGAEKTAARLTGIATSVSVARLPGELSDSGGDDVRDTVARSGEQAVHDAISRAVPWSPSNQSSTDQRPQVVVTDDESIVAGEVLHYLAEMGTENSESPGSPGLFQRAGVLAHVVNTGQSATSSVTLPAAVPQIRPLPRSILRERITQAVQLVVEVELDGEIIQKHIRPPDWLVKAIHERGDYGDVRQLSGITRTPVLRPDGTVLQEPGYDRQTGLLFLPGCDYPQVPEHPTDTDARQAVAELLEVLDDFPFQSEEHPSVWLAGVLTILGRPAINGPCPLFAFDGNTRGAGKSLLADLAGIITHGKSLARQAWPQGDENVRKAITAIALEAWPTVLFDNITSSLGGASLDMALTGTTWQDRILKESRTTGPLQLLTVWMATGNNLELEADTARRTLMCRLESPDEHPEDRDDFQHNDIRAYVYEHRARLAVAGLTILRAYVVAEQPGMQIPQWGSFEAWSRLVRHALVWAGCADPWQTRETVRDADRSAEQVRLIHAGIEEADIDRNGLTTADIERLLSHPVGQDSSDQWPTLRIAMTELCGAKPQSRKIGYGLRRFRGRVCAGKRLESRPGRGGVKRWFVERIENLQIESGGDGGNGGDEITQAGVKHTIKEPLSEKSTGVLNEPGSEAEWF